jgi:DNA gyrase subunit B
MITAEGKTIEGSDLRSIIDTIVKLNDLSDNINKRFDASIAEILCMNNLLNESIFNTKKSEDLTSSLSILNKGDLEPDKTDWVAEANDEYIEFYRFIRGVKSSKKLYKEQLDSPEFISLVKLAQLINTQFIGTPKLITKEKEQEISLPTEFFKKIIQHGQKGLSVQRFKGLGEMNAEQLWETTLDPTTRTLLQVKVGDIDEAEEIISTLMGSVVEPRRDFIKANALNVMNLDV